jgi:hypothetical protein
MQAAELLTSKMMIVTNGHWKKNVIGGWGGVSPFDIGLAAR